MSGTDSSQLVENPSAGNSRTTALFVQEETGTLEKLAVSPPVMNGLRSPNAYDHVRKEPRPNDPNQIHHQLTNQETTMMQLFTKTWVW